MSEGLAELLREEGGLLAAAVVEDAAPDPLLSEVPASHALVLAAVREGYRLHYDAGRVVRTEDADLALLAGDRLYALALARLAEAGDLKAVGELAELISRCAQAHAEEDPAQADAAWRAAASSFGR